MKLKRKEKIENLVKTLKVKHNELTINYCGKNPVGIEEHFCNEDNVKSFPPNGKLNASELDYFYYIMHNETVIGFYRITDLYFNDVIELHGSFNKHNTFLIKSYFELTIKFVSTIIIMFPSKRILAIAQSNNIGVINFLKYLNFINIGLDKTKNNFLLFEKISNMKVKIIKNSSSSNKTDFEKYIYLEEGESKFDYDDKAFVEKSRFDKNKRIIRITNFFEEKGKKKSISIYRKAICGNRNKLLGTTKKNEIGLLRRDMILLGIKQTENANIKISKNIFCFFSFYIFNPSYAVRISLISLFLGILSIILAILSFFIFCLKIALIT